MVRSGDGFCKQEQAERRLGMRTIWKNKVWIYVLLCLFTAAFISACSNPQPAEPNTEPFTEQTAEAQSDIIARAIQKREEQQMRAAVVEQRLATLEQAVADLKAELMRFEQQSGLKKEQSGLKKEQSGLKNDAYSLNPIQAQGDAWQQNAPKESPSQAMTPVQIVPAKPVETQKPAPTKRLPAAPSLPKAYQNALSLLLDQEKPEESRQAFSVFLTENPNSPLAPNVLYWVGETYYTEKKYDDAALLFKDVVARYPKHDKAADALYKGSLSYLKLNDAENAAYMQKLLLEDYPNSRAAKIFRQGKR
jgi:tol-pal system protein YbgF